MQTKTLLLAAGLALAALAAVPSMGAFNECLQPSQDCVSYYGIPPGTECHVNTYSFWSGGSLRFLCNPASNYTCASYLHLDPVKTSLACLDDDPSNGCLLGFVVADGVPEAFACT